MICFEVLNKMHECKCSLKYFNIIKNINKKTINHESIELFMHKK